MSQPRTFYRFASHGNPLCLRNSPHCPAVASKHRCTFGSILLQYFASEVCRVLSHTCELVWNALSNWISVCLGICLWVPSCLPVISALTLLGRSDLLCSGSSDLYSAYLASLSLRLHRSGFSSMKNWNLISASSSRGLRCGCISMLTLLPEFRPHFTAVPEPFCCCN